MESNEHSKFIKPSGVDEWHTDDFICNCLIKYLKKNGYKVHEEKERITTGKTEKIITASKFFTKEIIGIKGSPRGTDRSSLLKVFDKNSSSPLAKNWFYDSLFNSLINFGKYYSDENAVLAMALPNVERYKAIIDKVREYFTVNNLYFKLYLVNENSEVEAFNLNEKHL